MSYELRVAGKAPARFESEQEAVAAAKQAVTEDPNAEPEVIDLSTGKAAAPAADERSRDDLRSKIGF